jgi:hypothetical protein
MTGINGTFTTGDGIPRLCTAVIKAKDGYLEDSQIYLNEFNTFLVTT